MAHGSGPFCRVSRTPIPLEVATCVRKYFLGNDLSHQWRDILAFFASGMARMPRLTNRYNDRSHSPPSACVTFIHCASYGASHEVCQSRAQVCDPSLVSCHPVACHPVRPPKPPV